MTATAITPDFQFRVVIPTYARPAALSRCLQGLARQGPEAGAFEVVVVDVLEGAANILDSRSRVVVPTATVDRGARA